MKSIPIAIMSGNGCVHLESPYSNKSIGVMWDSGVQELAFDRPGELAEHDLLIMFERHMEGTWYSVNIGRKSKLTLNNAMTRSQELKIQVAFLSGEAIRFGAGNQLTFKFAKSPQNGTEPQEFISEYDRYLKVGITHGGTSGDRMSYEFYNIKNELVFSLPVLDGSGKALVDTLAPHRLYRIVSETGYFNLTDTSMEYPNYGQGMCVIGNTSVISLICNSDKNTDICRLVETDIGGSTIMRDVILPLGHANYVCHNPDNNKLYIAPQLHHSGGGQTAWQSILVYNYDTLTLDEEIKYTDLYPISISYDKVSGRMYMTDSEFNVYSFDAETREHLKLFRASESWAGISVGIQGITVRDGLFFVVAYSANGIVVLDDSGAVVKNYALSDWYELYHVGELEAADFDTAGNMYLHSVTYSTYPSYRYNQVWRCNPVTGNLQLNKRVLDAPSSTICISANASLNPTGTEDNPYPTAGEALLATQNPHYNFLQVRIYDSRDYDEVFYIRQSLNLYGNGNTVKMVICMLCSCAYIYGVSIVNNSDQPNCLRLERCGVVTIHNVPKLEHKWRDNTCMIKNEHAQLAIRGSVEYSGIYTATVQNDSAWDVVTTS